MRIVTLILAFAPASLQADVFPINSTPEQVTVHPDAARIARTATLNLPAGRHELRLSNLPYSLVPQLTDLQLNGAVLEGRIFRDTPTPTAELLAGTPEAQAAETALRAANEALAQHKDRVAEVQARAGAAQAQIEFLEGLQVEKLSLDVDGLRALGQTIAADGTAARAAVVAANAEARQLDQARDALEDAVLLARRAYEEISQPVENPQELSLLVNVPTAGQVTLDLEYWVGAVGWSPVYRMNLESESGELSIKRDVSIQQFTGEPWVDVDLTVTTIPARGQSIPSKLFPRLIRAVDASYARKSVVVQSPSYSSEFDQTAEAAAPQTEALVVAEEAAASFGGAQFSGAGVVYSFETPITVRAGEAALVALAPLDFETDVTARAVPRRDQTAFRMISFTNETDERILSGQAAGFVDGQAIGQIQLETIESGADVETGFGPIHGLQLKRAVLDKQEGDRGIIARENAQIEEVRITVENLTDKTWTVTLSDQVPYSEQEDLQVSWTAAPRPARVDHEDERGILEWDIELAPGNTSEVRLETDIRWPTGQIIQ